MQVPVFGEGMPVPRFVKRLLPHLLSLWVAASGMTGCSGDDGISIETPYDRCFAGDVVNLSAQPTVASLDSMVIITADVMPLATGNCVLMLTGSPWDSRSPWYLDSPELDTIFPSNFPNASRSQCWADSGVLLSRQWRVHYKDSTTFGMQAMASFQMVRLPDGSMVSIDTEIARRSSPHGYGYIKASSSKILDIVFE
jgi:hypothetical protein